MSDEQLQTVCGVCGSLRPIAGRLCPKCGKYDTLLYRRPLSGWIAQALALTLAGFLVDTAIIKRIQNQREMRMLAVSRYEAQMQQLADVRDMCTDLLNVRRNILICPHSNIARCELHIAELRQREIELALKLDWRAPDAFALRRNEAELSSDNLARLAIEFHTDLPNYSHDQDMIMNCTADGVSQAEEQARQQAEEQARQQAEEQARQQAAEACSSAQKQLWCDMKALNYCTEYLLCLAVATRIFEQNEIAKLDPNPMFKFEPMILDSFCERVLVERKAHCTTKEVHFSTLRAVELECK